MKYKYEQLHFHLKNHLARSRIMVIYYITIPQWQRTNKPLWLPLITHPFHWNCESFRFTLFSTRHTQTHMKSHPRLAHLMQKKWWEGHQHKCSNANVFCVRRQHVYHCLKTKSTSFILPSGNPHCTDLEVHGRWLTNTECWSEWGKQSAMSKSSAILLERSSF